MRVLQICSKPPLPAIDGGCMAMHNITEGLLENGVEVKILTISTEKHPFKRELLADAYLKSTKIESVFVDTKVKAQKAFLNLFSKKSYNVSRFYSKAFKSLIKSALFQNQYDVIFLEGLFVMPYLETIRKFSNAKVIYRAHNIEFEIWEKNAVASKKPLEKSYLNLLAYKLKKYELSELNKVDGIASITAADKNQLALLGIKTPMLITPFGIDIKNYKTTPVKHLNTLFYIGSMDWIPNQEAIKWLLTKVLPNVDVPFYLAGKSMPDEFKSLKQKNVTVVGEVSNAIDFINEHQIMLVPLFSGSGMRIKIIEAMALGKVVIATSLAAEGITCKHQEHILIANTALEFIEAIAWCFSHKNEMEEIGSNAKKMIALHYDNKVIVNNLVEFFKQIN